MKRLLSAVVCFYMVAAHAQNVGVGTVSPAAKLHVRGAADTFQLVIDAHTTQSPARPLLKLRNASGADLLWINSDNTANTFVGLNTGRFNSGTGNSFFGSLAADSNTTGNNNTVAGREALLTNRAGNNTVAIGYQAMRYANSSATSFTNTNLAVGYQALRGSVISADNTGTGNTAVGYQVLLNNEAGFNNTAIGRGAMESNIGGDNNTALGYQAMNDNTSGLNNTAAGFQALFNNALGDRNTAIGVSAMLNNYAGDNGTAVGSGAMQNANSRNTVYTNTSVAFGYQALMGSPSPSNNTGISNSAIGYTALRNNSSGFSNTALGMESLYTNSTGNYNTALGSSSLYENKDGNYNVGVGYFTLNANTTGIENVAAGSQSMRSNTTGNGNVALGHRALFENINGSNGTAIGNRAMSLFYGNAVDFTNYNTAVGFEAYMGGAVNPLFNTGNHNTAVGYQTLRSNLSGNYNVAMGSYALQFINTGSFNTGIGMYTLFDSGADNLTAIGYSAGSAFSNFSGCTFVGYNSETNAGTYDNAMALGNNAVVTGSDRVRVGNASVTSIGGQVGWTTFSDGRFKINVTENIPGLDFILKLRPVSYNTNITALNTYIGVDRIRAIKEARGEKIAVDKTEAQQAIRHSGFIAQEVEQAAKALGFDFSGVDAPKNDKDIYGIRYAEFVVPLVKAIQEQQKIIDDQAKITTKLQQQVEALMLELKQLKENK
ncbi:MAG: tail fiber domain-containing protein [Chitinophagaceae bacterium]|nr:tail fiber domain-containing protein [Chitinophagaceae bacterium]